MNTNQTTDIAIIGMSALFPGAKDLQTYWQNIFNKVDAVREASDKWTGCHFDPKSTENDRIYTRKGGFLGDLAKFNPLEFGIMPNSVDGIDSDNLLGLKLAKDALKDAGYLERHFNQQKVGIILGRGTYLHRGNATWLQHGMVVDQTLNLLQQINPELDTETLDKIRQELKASIPPFNAETVPGLVPNVITGRIANRLNLMGPNYLVDAACASSLVAIELAIRELLNGDCEMMLAGGIHTTTPPQGVMLFTNLNALSRTNIRPFDSAADGTLLGEGLGIVVLKRLTQAQTDGDRIYAVIKAMGSSSDGKALGLLAPRFEGEVLALERAYQENDIAPQTIGLIEAHGTATMVGDRTEIQALSHVFGQRRGDMPNCAIGSVKSMISHCLPAAGAASIIKTALALYHKVLPPTLCDQVNPDLGIEKTPFYVNNQTRPWIHPNTEIPRRAGVNAFGFGGINAHAILEEYTGTQQQEVKQLHKDWPTELLVFSGDNRQEVTDLINQVQRLIEANPNISLAGLAYTLSYRPTQNYRATVIAKDLADLQAKLSLILDKLNDPKRTQLQTRTGIYYKEPDSRTEIGKIAFVFPGEGSQYTNMLADLCLYFPQVRAWFDFLDETFADTRKQPPSSLIFPPPTSLTEAESELAAKQLFSMNVASEIVFTASMALHELLSDLGIKPDVMLGHSTGEFAALFASGVVRLNGRKEMKEKIRLLNGIYQDLETKDNIAKGCLMTVGGIDSSFLQELIDRSEGNLYLAMDNCPNQAVLFGSDKEIAAVTDKLKAAGGICIPLPFDRAYHTPLFENVEKAFCGYYDALEVGKGETILYSCATADAFPEEAEAIRTLAAKQWSSRVKFRETIEKLYSQGVKTFIEVGPSSNLTAFVDDILRNREFMALASNSQRKSGLTEIQNLLARLLVNGIEINLEALYQHRLVSELKLDEAVIADDKSIPIVDTTMPVMQLRPQFVEEIRHKLRLEKTVVTQEAIVSAVKEEEEFENSTQESKLTFKFSQSPISNPQFSVTEEEKFENGKEENKLTFQPSQSSITNHQSPIPNPQSPNSRLEILTGHFDLMQEFLANQEKVTTMVYSSLGNYNHTNFAQTPLTQAEAFPLLGQILERDETHLYCERRFDLEQDIFLYDHTIGGKLSSHNPQLIPLPVIPFTISMEILAEAATALLGEDKVVIGLDNLRGYRWLALDQGQIVLSIKAQLQPQTDLQTWIVHVQLFQKSISSLVQEETLNTTPVFEGYVRLAKQFPSSPQPIHFNWNHPQPSAYPDTDLYRTGMFHGPRFQGVKHIRQWDKQGIEANLQVIDINDFFQNITQPIFQIDAGLLDAAGQLVGYWVLEQIGTDFNVFPYQVKSFQQYQPPLPGNSPVLCRGLMHFTSETQTEAIFDFIDQTGNVIARLEGWQDRFFPVPHKYYQCRLHPQSAYLSESWMQAETKLICRRLEPFPEGFIDQGWEIWKRVLAHLMLNEREREFWYQLPEKGQRRTDWLLGRIAAKDALRQWAKQTLNLELAPVDIEILSTELGKPVARFPQLEILGNIPDVSISHSRGYIVAVLGQLNMNIGIDLERLNYIRHDDWFNYAFTKEELDLLPHPYTLAAVIGLWCAKEAVAKALGTGLQGNPNNLLITDYSTDGQQVTVTGEGNFFQVQLWHQNDEILAICQASTS